MMQHIVDTLCTRAPTQWLPFVPVIPLLYFWNYHCLLMTRVWNSFVCKPEVCEKWFTYLAWDYRNSCALSRIKVVLFPFVFSHCRCASWLFTLIMVCWEFPSIFFGYESPQQSELSQWYWMVLWFAFCVNMMQRCESQAQSFRSWLSIIALWLSNTILWPLWRHVRSIFQNIS